MATGLTDQAEAALERSAFKAFEACGFDPTPDDDLGEWELALWGDFSTILVNRTTYIAAIVTRDGIGNYTTELIDSTRLGFLADQIHRCSAGALNGYRPATEVSFDAFPPGEPAPGAGPGGPFVFPEGRLIPSHPDSEVSVDA